MRVEPCTEIQNYLDAPYDMIWAIGNATGLRITDILQLRVKHLKPEKPTIHEQKTGKSKRIRIPAKTRKQLLIMTAGKNDDDFIFGSTSKTGHLTRQAVHKAYKRAAKMAHTKKNVGTHSMRKNYALRLYRHGDLTYVQHKLNHDNAAETALYLLGKDRTNE